MDAGPSWFWFVRPTAPWPAIPFIALYMYSTLARRPARRPVCRYRLAAKPQGALHGTKLMFRALEDGPAVSSGNLTALEPDLNSGAHARL